MKTKTSTRVSVDLVPDFHAEVKASAKTLKNYVKDALSERVPKDREVESEAYLKHLLNA